MVITTCAVLPTRRGARPKYVWNADSPTKRLFFLWSVYILARLPRNAESPTERLFLLWSVYILARLPNKHNHRRRGYILKTFGLVAPMMNINMSYETRKGEAKSRASWQAWSSSSGAALNFSSFFWGHVPRPMPWTGFDSSSSPSHQKPISSDDESKPNKLSPSSPEPTSWLRLCTWVTAAAALAIAASQSPCAFLCVFVLQVFSAYYPPRKEAAQLICLAASRFSWQPPFENLGRRFCQESTFPAIWKSWKVFVQDFVS